MKLPLCGIMWACHMQLENSVLKELLRITVVLAVLILKQYSIYNIFTLFWHIINMVLKFLKCRYAEHWPWEGWP